MKTILRNTLRYWLDRLTADTTQARLPDPDLEGIARAIEAAIALQSRELWELALDLTSAIESHMRRYGHWHEWDRFMQSMVAEARARGDRESEGRLLLVSGYVGLHGRDRRASIASFSRAARLFKALHQEGRLATAYSNLGYLYMTLGQYWRAEVLNRGAIALFESEGDTRRMAYTENHLGLCFHEQRRWVEAEAHLTRASELMVEAGDTQGLALALHNLGGLHARRESFDLAEQYYLRARSVSLSAGNWPQVALILNDLGTMLQKQGRLQEAEATYAEAESAFQSLGDGLRLAYVRHNLGMTYTQLKTWGEAERCFERALEHWRAEKDELNLANTLGELAGLYLAWGRPLQARTCIGEAEIAIQQRSDARAEHIREELRARRASLHEATTGA